MFQRELYQEGVFRTAGGTACLRRQAVMKKVVSIGSDLRGGWSDECSLTSAFAHSELYVGWDWMDGTVIPEQPAYANKCEEGQSK